MKLKRSEIDSKSKLFESDDKHIKFVDTDFPENFVIVTKSCKTLRFKNCFFECFVKFYCVCIKMLNVGCYCIRNLYYILLCIRIWVL